MLAATQAVRLVHVCRRMPRLDVATQHHDHIGVMITCLMWRFRGNACCVKAKGDAEANPIWYTKRARTSEATIPDFDLNFEDSRIAMARHQASCSAQHMCHERMR